MEGRANSVVEQTVPSAAARRGGIDYGVAKPHNHGDSHAGTGMVRLIGLYKLVKALLMLTVGVTALHLVHHDVVAVVARWVRHLHLDPENRVLVHQVLPRLARLTDGRLRLLGCGALMYTILYTIQGIGLLEARRWAEWLTVVSGVGLVPFEVYELFHRPTWIKAAVLVSNLAIAVYLYYHVRGKTAKDRADQAESTAAARGPLPGEAR